MVSTHDRDTTGIHPNSVKGVGKAMSGHRPRYDRHNIRAPGLLTLKPQEKLKAKKEKEKKKQKMQNKENLIPPKIKENKPSA